MAPCLLYQLVDRNGDGLFIDFVAYDLWTRTAAAITTDGGITAVPILNMHVPRVTHEHLSRVSAPHSATEPLMSGIAMIKAPMESGEITASAYLVVASTGSWCDIHALVPGTSVVIGRGGENQIVLHSNRCSRRHCEIFSENGDWFIRDLKSRNGTRLNDRPLRRVKPLNPGDRIEIAGTVFLLTSSICEIEGASLDSSIHDADTTTAVDNIHLPNGKTEESN